MRFRYFFTDSFSLAAGVILLLGLAPFARLAAQDDAANFVIQRISDLSTIHSLDTPAPGSPAAHTWWATAAELDPVTYSRRVLEGRPAADSTDTVDWTAVAIPGDLFVQGVVEDTSKPAWYHKTFYLNGEVQEPLAVRLGEISDRDVAYLNGVRIGATGTFDSPRPEAYDRHRLYMIPEGVLRNDGVNVLLVQVQGYFEDNVGIFRNTTQIGPARLLLREYYVSNFLAALILVIYFTVGAYFLFLFLRRRVEKENLFFTLFAWGLVLYQFLRTQLKYELGLDFWTMKKIEYLALSTMPGTFYFFLRSYFDLARPAAGEAGEVAPRRFLVAEIWLDRLVMAALAVHAAQFILVLFTTDTRLWSWFNDTFFLPSVLVFLVPFFALVTLRALQRERDAYYILGGLLLFIASMFVDAGSHYGYYNLPRTLGFTFVVFVLSMALVLANRFVRLNQAVEDLNRNLERKVEQRTEELNTTLQKVRKLKEQQDGDYFLTSLLVRPLGGNFTKNEFVNVDMLERQKKQFTFRDRDSELGGDLNVAHDLRLRDRNYVLFLNGDAMGKSMQGAGGALVLGTVFKSVLNRTRHSKTVSRMYPEQWLRQAYRELQDAFITFDGTMLVSVVVGLVEEHTGMLYYVNAEHPYVALYRDGRARFIEEDLSVRKIGIDLGPELGGELRVKSFVLEPGDVIFSGSDGRDDIMIGEDDGRRVLNEDEHEFLRRIEDGGGELGAVEQALRSKGELTDDLTIIRVGFREGQPLEPRPHAEQTLELLRSGRRAYRDGHLETALEEWGRGLELDPEHPEILRELAKLRIRRREYDRARDLCLLYAHEHPADATFLYYTSFVLKQLAEYESAADFGERCHLRDPENLNNLVCLADVYRLSGAVDRARVILERAERLDDSHEKVKQLAQALSD